MPVSWKVLVISDTHERVERAERVIRELQESIDAVYFLGDYLADGEELSRMFPRLAFLCVAGNCDFTNRSLFHEVQVAGHRLYLCHGHRHGVKEGYDSLRAFGLANHYDVVLCGHTHRPYLDDADDLMIVNPGSIGEVFPIYGSDYAILKLKENERPACRLFNSTEPVDAARAFLNA